MTSTSRQNFDKNRGDIDRLLEIHGDVTPSGPGRKWKVDSLHKASIVLLSAFWEAFCEDLAAEALEHLVTHATDAHALPEPLRKRVAKEILAAKDPLAAWSLADGKWRSELRSRLQALQDERNTKLNTPKTWNISKLFADSIGIVDVEHSWYWKGMSAERAGLKLDTLVTLRGDIAHRGSSLAGVTKPIVESHYTHVQQLVVLTEAHIAQELLAATGQPLWAPAAETA
ncbi:HEPN domain-containing protein [Streptomyces halstedii]|uniref:HEPN domain-containing protein n=1 Tax=Streptomyces halstedii TaxID=1944 RepID=UPI0034601BB8